MIKFNSKNKNIEHYTPEQVTTFLDRCDKLIKQADKIDPEIGQALKFSVLRDDNQYYNANINKNLLGDMEALIHGKSYYPKFNRNTSINEILSSTELGDAISIDGQMYVNNGSTIESINISETNYQKLFPPVSRFNSKQSKSLGNCYFIDQLQSLMNSGKGRCQLYKMFSEDSNGNLYVKTDANKNALLIDNIPNGLHHSNGGSLGIIAIELAYGAGMNDNPNITKVSQITKQMEQGGWPDFGKKGLENLLGDNCKVLEYTFDYKEVQNILRNKLNNYVNRDDVLIQVQFSKRNPKYNMIQSHAYSLKSYDAENHIFTITNPHRAGVDIRVPENEILPYISKFYATQIL